MCQITKGGINLGYDISLAFQVIVTPVNTVCWIVQLSFHDQMPLVCTKR